MHLRPLKGEPPDRKNEEQPPQAWKLREGYLFITTYLAGHAHSPNELNNEFRLVQQNAWDGLIRVTTWLRPGANAPEKPLSDSVFAKSLDLATAGQCEAAFRTRGT